VERYVFGFALLEGSGYGTELANFVPGREKRFAVEEDNIRKLADLVLWLQN